MRLPSPVLVHDILPAILVTGHLGEDEGALEPVVQWSGHIVVHPPPPRPVALLVASIPLFSCPSDCHLHLIFLAFVKEEDDGAGQDEESHQGGHDAPHSNWSMEHRHLVRGF